MTETFVAERPHVLTGNLEAVTIDDASACLARFANGALATFEATRYARGHKALYTLEINGEHGSIAWDLHDLHRLALYDHRDESTVRGWRSIHVSDGDHPYMKHWWVPGLQIGYEHSFIHQMADFLLGLDRGERGAAGAIGVVGADAPGRTVGRGRDDGVPSFREAMATDRVTDAILASARGRQWTRVTDGASS